MAKLLTFVVALIAVSISLALSSPAPDEVNLFPQQMRVASAP
jgi:hypothetical protein